MSELPPPRSSGLPGGWVTALVCGLLLVGTFALATSGTVMPPRERWAALTTFGLLALAFTLLGSPELYDALGHVVRRDLRALGSLLLLVPALYASYSNAVNTFSLGGLFAALAFVAVPALTFGLSARQRSPTLPDLIGTLYILLTLALGLLPALPLPQQGGQIDFFYLSLAPLLLLLLAARGWPGLGFTWFMTRQDVLGGVLVGALLLLVLAPLALLTDMAQLALLVPGFFDVLVLAVYAYFLVALPQEILFRGLVQNGITRFAEVQLWRGPGSLPRTGLLQPRWIGLLGGALVMALLYLLNPLAPPQPAPLVLLAALGYGWVYQRTGKVTVSAVPHMLVNWCWMIFFV